MTSSAKVMTCRVKQYIGVKKISPTMWGTWESEDAEFIVDFQNRNLSL
jgi:hypothetical protein